MSKPQKLPACTDTGNAELFAQLNSGQVRYHHRRKSWLIWRDHWWAEDLDGNTVRLAQQAARFRLRTALKLPDETKRKAQVKWSLSSESHRCLRATLELACCHKSLADLGERWDSKPLLLGVANGVVNLRTGELGKGNFYDRITLHSDISFDLRAQCPRWLQFLEEVFLGDRELIEFVGHAVGYSLTGLTTEQCLFLCHGEGANGKSTFLEVLRSIAGGCALNLSFSAFELNQRSSISNDVAALAGRRLVTAVETDESARLNEARIKGLTGGDIVTARFMYKEYFEFRPVAKFWLAVNHKPTVADDSHGFWRRIRLIPFLAQFNGERRDDRLLEKLRKEAPGILAWAVSNCLEWQRKGLGVPVAVRAATEEYREDSDSIHNFLAERCRIIPGAQITAAVLWDEYQNWARATNERQVLDRRQFASRLLSRRLKKSRVGHSRTWAWVGICLNADDTSRRVPGEVSGDADVRTDADVKIH